jgi:hypothetical protein
VVAFDGAAQAMVAENTDYGLRVGGRWWTLWLEILVTRTNQLDA